VAFEDADAQDGKRGGRPHRHRRRGPDGQDRPAQAPGIGTTATDGDDGDHEAVADDSVTINDEVAYKGLTPGQEYTLTGTLMDKETGKPVQSGGKDVTSTVAFTPDKADGTQTVTFTFNGADLGGHETSWLSSRCRRTATEVAVHTDINDEGQTVKLTTPDEEQPSRQGRQRKSGLPKTGDELPWIAIVCALGAAACGAGVTVLAKRRMNSGEKDDGQKDGEGDE
jgi:hypothetical protein